MPVNDDHLHTILRFLDNDLSDSEAAAFIQEVAQNAELQQAFDQQVLMSEYLLEKDDLQITVTGLESADDFLEHIHPNENTSLRPSIVALPATKRRWQFISVAAAVAAIVMISTYYFLRQNKPTVNPVVTIPHQQLKLFVKDSAIGSPDTIQLLADTYLPQKLYEENYKVLSGNELTVPLAAQPYQWQYEQGRYDELAAEKETVLSEKGQVSAGEQQEILNYFRFYKALANLQLNNTSKAINLLTAMQLAVANYPTLYDQVSWFLLMAYLKSGNQARARQTANLIAKNRYSKYYLKAASIVQKLAVK